MSNTDLYFNKKVNNVFLQEGHKCIFSQFDILLFRSSCVTIVYVGWQMRTTLRGNTNDFSLW